MEEICSICRWSLSNLWSSSSCTAIVRLISSTLGAGIPVQYTAVAVAVDTMSCRPTSTSVLRLKAAFLPSTFNFNMSCRNSSYSRKGSTSLTANASFSPVALGLDRQTRAWTKTPEPRVGKFSGGSTVVRMTSGTHFFPQSRHGTSFRFEKGANR